MMMLFCIMESEITVIHTCIRTIVISSCFMVHVQYFKLQLSAVNLLQCPSQILVNRSSNC